MIPYIIQVNVTLILFYGAYVLFLKQETDFRVVRIYLIISLLGSIFIPFVDLDSVSSLFFREETRVYEYWLPDLVTQSRPIAETSNSLELFSKAIAGLYFLGVFISLGKIIIPLLKLRRMIRISKIKKDNIGWYFALDERQSSFSFFHYIFLGNKSWHSVNDLERILSHERAHSNRWHSFDVMLVQIVGVLVWFNPVIYWYRDALEQIHEFEADQIASQGRPDEYCTLLVKDTIDSSRLAIANHFNKSLTLKRIAMIKSMKKNMSRSKKLGLFAAFITIVIVVACEEKVTTDLKKAAGQSVLLSEYPQQVLDALDKIKENYPYAEPKVYGVVRTEHLENLELNGKTATVIFADSDPNYKFYVILGADEVNYASSKFFEIKNGEKIYSLLQTPANPVDGMTEFYKFISENLKYPAQARRMGIEGRVFIKFMVDEHGKLSDFQVLRGIGAGCDAEALRVMNLAPNWKPGIQDGAPVKSIFNLAIVFKLDEKSDGD